MSASPKETGGYLVFAYPSKGVDPVLLRLTKVQNAN